jgi:taurine dioxygenase
MVATLAASSTARAARRTNMSPTLEATLTFSPYSPTIGMEIGGIDLRRKLSDATIAEVRNALTRWKVVFFRDQDITTEQHLAFARRFGSLEVHPFAPSKPGYPEVLAITHDEHGPGKENVWHSDVTWRLEPSLGSILLNKECPAIGGDTLFADMEAAYDGLPEHVKDRVDELTAVHDFGNFRAGMRKRGATEEEIAVFDAKYPNPEHPVIRTHPETGRRSIYVNAAFAQRIVGLEDEESRPLLDLLFRQAHLPEYQCRFRWQQHSIAFWDNRSSQHYAVSDYWPNSRSAERVTIMGEKPFFDPASPREIAADRPFRGHVETLRLGKAVSY